MDAVHRPDQLHALKVFGVELGHHSLELGAVEHADQGGLDHIAEMVAQGDLVAAQLPGLAVEIAPAHLGAEIAGRVIPADAVGRGKDVRLEDGDGDVQKLGVALDLLTVGGVIARVHDEKDHLEGYVADPVELLHEFG